MRKKLDDFNKSLAEVSYEIRKIGTKSANEYLDVPDQDLALQSLEQILKEHAAFAKHVPRPSAKEGLRTLRQRSSIKKLTRTTSYPSDTDHHEDFPVIPSTNVVLDNTRAVGSAECHNQDGWLDFKNEIIRLTHTLRLKGWRRVALDQGADIEVQRISGALTNAVYVVTPPKALLEMSTIHQRSAYVSTRRPL